LGLGEINPALRQATAPLAISAQFSIDLMEAAAKFLRRPDLGIHYAEWRDPHRYGPLALLGETSTTYCERFQLSRRFVHLQNNAVSFDHVNEGDDVAVLCVVHAVLRPRARQFMESLVALSVRNARSLLGGSWNPARVEFAHAPPPSISAHKRFFRCPIYFRSERDAFVMSNTDFRRRLPKGDPETIAFLEKHLASQQEQWPIDFRGQVDNLIAAQLAGGGVSLARIAALLAVSPRTLQRRLSEHGEDFGEILTNVRVQIVRNCLSQRPPPPLAKLSYLLGYSEPSAASRFIKLHLRKSARDIVRELRMGAPNQDANASILGFSTGSVRRTTVARLSAGQIAPTPCH
jgi:AraC-like DNA-binding protein